MLYNITIYPVEIIYKSLYLFISSIIGSYGISLIVLSIVTTILILPFMHWANGMQASEKHLQDVMLPQLKAIKQESTGAEQHKRITNLYRRYGYHPIMAVRSAAGVALQIPFLMAAYYMLSTLPNIQGQTFLLIKDLSKPDGLLWGVNLLPILMTVINIFSACTTKNFAAKDKIQAAIIAFLFLLLLYDATSALLVFWTCNNLWILLGNLRKMLFERIPCLQITTIIQGHSATLWSKNRPYYISVIIALTSTFCIFIPINIYLNNVNEFWFNMYDILPPAFICFVIITIIFLFITLCLNKIIRNYFIYLLFGLTVGLCLQSYILKTNYGVLDGRQILWGNYYKYAIINTLIWIVCIFFPFILSIFINCKLRERFFKNISLLLIFIQFCSSAFIASSVQLKPKVNYYLSTTGMFNISAHKNIIIFTLDTFDTELFQKIIKLYPDLYNNLNGFTYYPDAVGSYSTTKGAIPQILTNKWYSNNGTYSNYINKAWSNNKFWEILKKLKFDIRIYTEFLFVRNNQYVANLKEGEYNKINSLPFIMLYYKLTAFRSVPHIFKHIFWLYTGEFNKFQTLKINNDNAYLIDDVEFYNSMTSKKLAANNNDNCFRFYHLMGAHPPFTMSKNIERLQNGKKSDETNQTLACLKIVIEYLRQMKSLHVYDNAIIFIIADHGYPSIYRRPLVIVKYANNLGPMKISENPISYNDIQATIMDALHQNASKFGIPFSIRHPQKHTRRFMYYDWNSEWWADGMNKDCLPPIVEYSVYPHAQNAYSWVKRKDNKLKEYRLGERLLFTSLIKQTNISDYIDSGWDIPENSFTWTDGTQASLSFNISAQHKDLLLRMNLFPYLGGNKYHSQIVGVYANNTKISEWIVTKENWYNAIIPANLVKKSKLKILLTISNPVSPKDVGESVDPRKLGIAASELIITSKQ